MKHSLFNCVGFVGVVFCYLLFSSNTTFSFHQSAEDSLDVERRKFIVGVLDSIKGKETIAADSVFHNIKTFDASQRLPVRHFLAVMNYWGEALGVSCTYCHNTNNWASDDLRTKRIARDMYRMRSTINEEILSKINDLKSKPARINCGTCHNGQPIPKR